MDPPAMMSDGRYNLAKIWHYPLSESGISRGQFGHGLAQFGDPTRQVSGNGPVSLEQQQRRGGVRRRRDGEDEAAKVVSTSSISSGNAVVFIFSFLTIFFFSSLINWIFFSFFCDLNFTNSDGHLLF